MATKINPLSIEDILELTNHDDIRNEIENLLRMRYIEKIDGNMTFI